MKINMEQIIDAAKAITLDNLEDSFSGNYNDPDFKEEYNRIIKKCNEWKIYTKDNTYKIVLRKMIINFFADYFPDYFQETFSDFGNNNFDILFELQLLELYAITYSYMKKF